MDIDSNTLVDDALAGGAPESTHPSPADDVARTAEQDESQPHTEVPAFEALNEVRLTGSLADPGEERELAGGVHVVRWSLRVPRGSGRGGSDLIDCVALEEPLQSRALGWLPGAVLTVEGALRRRFFRSGGRTATRVEVEAHAVIEVEPSVVADAPPPRLSQPSETGPAKRRRSLLRRAGG